MQMSQTGDKPEIEIKSHRDNVFVEMLKTVYKERGGHKQEVGRKTVGRWAFVRLDQDRLANHVKGDPATLEENPVIYIGSAFDKPYWDSKPTEDVPKIVLREVVDSGLTIYENVNGGWENWEECGATPRDPGTRAEERESPLDSPTVGRERSDRPTGDRAEGRPEWSDTYIDVTEATEVKI